MQAKLTMPIVALLLFNALSLRAGDVDAPEFLSSSEREWLSSHPVIKVAPDPDFPPIEGFDENGRFVGIAADFAALVERKLGVTFEIVRCPSWDDVLKRARSREVDMLSGAAQSPQRSEYMMFSDPHIVLPAVVICRKDVKTDVTLKDLKGMRLAVVESYVWQEFISRDYPDLELDLVPDVQTGLRKVSFGMVDGMVANIATAVYYIEKEGIPNLRVAGETGYLSKLSFAIRKDWPELHGIIEKTLATVSTEERASMTGKWIRLGGPVSGPGRTFWIALLIGGVAGGAAIMVVLAWNHSLKRQVQERTSELTAELAERKRAQEALRLSEIKFRDLVQNANSIILRLDKHGNITFFNGYAQHFFGFSEEEIIGRNVRGTIVPKSESETGRDLTGMIDDVFRTPDKFEHNENENVRKDGARVWIAWNNKPIYSNDGELEGLLCVGSDITARREAEALVKQQQEKLIQADKMATLGILVSGVAHEINNPNNFMLLNSNNLTDIWNDLKPLLDKRFQSEGDFMVAGMTYSEMRDEVAAMIGGISDGAERIRKIVQSLKDFARRDSEDMNQKVDVATIIDSSATILGNLIKKSTDSFEVACDDGLPRVRGNAQQLEQVIINLVSNACQAMEDRNKPVTVAASHDRKAGTVKIVVRDEGGGISEDDLAHIMDPFYTTKRDSGGTGLGLSISYKIVKSHGGVLKMESQPGVGTVAVVSLPVQGNARNTVKEPS